MTVMQDSTQPQRARERLSPTTEGSVAWAFGNLVEAALRRGFRCRRAQRQYQRWLHQLDVTRTEELLLMERDFERSVFHLVAYARRNDFGLAVTHQEFQATLDVTVAGEGSALELVTVVVTSFEGNLQQALIWAADRRSWFLGESAKATPKNGTSSSLSLTAAPQVDRVWFGGGKKPPMGEC